MGDEDLIGQVAAISPQAEEKAQRGVNNPGEAAEDPHSVADAMADEYRDRAEGVWDDARRRVRTLQDDSKQYVRENPARAVLAALCVGFLVGFTFHR